MIETYDMSLEISRKCKLDEPEFSNAEKEHIQNLLIEWYATRITRLNDVDLACEALDQGVIL